MRFNRLDIIRYGALTDRPLNFRTNATLHVIYGPNEAGKSSALEAISDLLFGFSHTTKYDFLYDSKDIRIGAEIAASNGAILNFRRRKGNKATLLSADDNEKALPDDALSPFLGNLTRKVSERAFSLNSLRLRNGGKEMLQSGGEIGSLLFSAASGMTGVSELRQSLATEAERIYATRRSKDRSFYQAYDRYESARQLESKTELKSGDWKKLLSEASETEAMLDALRRERQETKQALDRLNMLKKLEPLAREIDTEESLLHSFADLSAIPPGFDQRLAEALEARKLAEDALAAAIRDADRLRDEIRSVTVDVDLLDAFGSIMQHHTDKGVYLNAKKDILRIGGEVEDFDQRLVLTARKLGLPDAEELERRQPTEADIARLRTLASEGRDLKRAHAENRRGLEEERERLRRLDTTDISGRLIDPTPYQQKLQAIQPDIGELARLDQLEVNLSRAETQLVEAVSRLSPPVMDLDQLLATPLPDIATLTEQRRTLQDRQAALRETSQELRAIETERQDIGKEIAVLERGGNIVTRQDIAAARATRDETLDRFLASPATVHQDLKAAVEKADRMVDDALSDAERVSTHARLSLRLAELEPTFLLAEQRRNKATDALDASKAEFRALFAAAGIEPGDADQMIDWRRAIEALAKQRETVNTLADECSTLRRMEQRLMPILSELADATGLAGAESLPAAALYRGLSQHIREIVQRWTNSRSAEGERQSVADAVARLEERDSAIRTDADRWQAALAEAASVIGLSETATVEMAEAVVDLWKDLPQTLAERENRRRRVRGMQRDIAAFEEVSKSLASRLANDLAAYSADSAIDILHGRAIAANAGAERRKGLLASLEQAESRQARCQSDAEARDADLATLALTAPDAGDLSELLSRLRERKELEESLSLCRRRFHEQAEGEDEADIRSTLESFDRIEAGLEIERLEALDSDQLQRFGALTAKLTENQRQQRALETGPSAEYAVFEKHAAEEEARELARQWVVLKLAARMLGKSMENYREQQADPVMTRAGEIFSVLTGGRFARLVQDYDQADELQLLAERVTGERVPLPGLSEGTGDQLYLALRLAFLEDYSARNEPAPLIVDDIFQTFDDDRTAAGLKALAATAGRFQTILFTHETSVVDIAKAEIGKDLDLIRF